MASCTTTIVIVRTSAARLTIDAATAIVPKISIAASGPPLSHRGTRLWSYAWSIAIVPNDRATPASTQVSGMNHRPARSLENRLRKRTGGPHLSGTDASTGRDVKFHLGLSP